MLALALVVVGAMSDEVQVTPTTWRFFDPEFGVVCYVTRDKAQSPSVACVQIPFSPSAPVAPVKK